MKAIRTILFVLIVIGIGLLMTQKMWVPWLVNKIISYQNKSATTQIETKSEASTGANTTVSGDVSCVDNSSYFVVSKSLKDSVGSDILVKYKTSTSQNFACSYIVKLGDFEIKNQKAEYFYGITNNFLITDSGTGPNERGLIVYDLNLKKKVFEDTYTEPLSIQNNSLTYWTSANTKATSQNCPKLAEYTSQGLVGVIERHVTLDLSNLTKKDLGESRCSPAS